MAVDQTITCDKDGCGKTIDGNHVELYYSTKAVDPDAGDHAYESGTFQFHLECFDSLRDPLNIDNPQVAFKEEQAAARNQEAVEQEAVSKLEKQRKEAGKK